MRIRAAFDIGSGAAKLQVAKVDPRKGTIEKVFFSEQQETLLLIDMEKRDGNVGVDLSNFLLKTVSEYKQKADEIGAQEFSAIATEVFRKAKNGCDLLDKIKKTIGIDAQLISQEAEGKLGFLTAVAESRKDKNNVISWDSGGGSFQIVTMIDEKIHVYGGPFGSGNTTRLMIESIQKKSFKVVPTPNPVTQDEAKNLVALIENSIDSPPSWVSKKATRQGYSYSLLWWSNCSIYTCYTNTK